MLLSNFVTRWIFIFTIASGMMKTKGGLCKMRTDVKTDYIEFRKNLRREGTEFSEFLYECQVTRVQRDQLFEVMNKYLNIVCNGEEVYSGEYETDVLEVVRDRGLDYHFCECFARLLWEDHQYEEVFEALYSSNPKYHHLFK